MSLRRVFENYRGFRYYKNNISILVKAVYRTKNNTFLTDEQQLNYSQTILNFYRSVKGLERANKNDGLILQPDNFKEFDNQSFYKYVPNHVLIQSIKKGIFQLGSIKYYKDTENKKIQDNMEGYSNLVINSNQRQVAISLMSGFNFYIFCGTASCNEPDHMKNSFGQRIIEIPNIISFAKAIQKSIGAIRFYVNYIHYSDLKTLVFTDNEFDVEAAVSPDISESIFDSLYLYSFLPSLFAKPSGFAPEKEIRIVFEMPRDVKKYIRISNLGLLDKIRII